MIHTNKCFQSSKIYFHRDMYFIWQRLNYVHFPVEVGLNGHNLKMMGHGIHTRVCLTPNLFIPSL